MRRLAFRCPAMVSPRRRATFAQIDFSKDRDDFAKLNDNEQKFLKQVISFFASADGIVIDNLQTNFASEVQWSEASMFFCTQAFFEAIHAETYGLQLVSLVPDRAEQLKLSRAFEENGAVKKKTQWMQQWLSRDRSFQERVFAWMCTEGVLFSSSFASIFYFKKKYAGKMPGLCVSNEFISRDEALHCSFAQLILKEGGLEPLPEKRAQEIMRGAVDVEIEFVRSALQTGLLGMSSSMMIQYVQHVSNYWMNNLGYSELFPGVKNPFEFMELISLQAKSNFFEKRVSEYAKAGVGLSDEAKEEQKFSLDTEF